MSEFISLYSGSSGNCSVVRTGEKYIIIDMGKGVRTTSAALKELGLNISDCAGILVTHEHSDHVKGLATFLKRIRCRYTAQTIRWIFWMQAALCPPPVSCAPCPAGKRMWEISA